MISHELAQLSSSISTPVWNASLEVLSPQFLWWNELLNTYHYEDGNAS